MEKIWKAPNAVFQLKHPITRPPNSQIVGVLTMGIVNNISAQGIDCFGAQLYVYLEIPVSSVYMLMWRFSSPEFTRGPEFLTVNLKIGFFSMFRGENAAYTACGIGNISRVTVKTFCFSRLTSMHMLQLTLPTQFFALSKKIYYWL